MEKETKKKRKLLNLKKFEIKIEKNNYYAFYYNNLNINDIKIQKYVFKNIDLNINIPYLQNGKSPLSTKIIDDENSFFRNLEKQDTSRILLVQENVVFLKCNNFNIKNKVLTIFFCFLNLYNMTAVYFFNKSIKEKI